MKPILLFASLIFALSATISCVGPSHDFTKDQVKTEYRPQQSRRWTPETERTIASTKDCEEDCKKKSESEEK